MRHRLEAAGLDEEVEIESAGTGSWHVGHPPDERSAAAALRRGVELGGAARQVDPGDFERFDLLVAMDHHNHADLRALAPSPEHEAKVRLLREFDPVAVEAGDLAVPDPYYGEGDGFERVLDVVERGCDGLIESLRR